MSGTRSLDYSERDAYLAQHLTRLRHPKASEMETRFGDDENDNPPDPQRLKAVVNISQRPRAANVNTSCTKAEGVIIPQTHK